MYGDLTYENRIKLKIIEPKGKMIESTSYTTNTVFSLGNCKYCGI